MIGCGATKESRGSGGILARSASEADTPPVSLASPYTAEDRQRWKQALLAKGREVSAKLEEILAGKDVSLDDFRLEQNGEPAETKEKRLRRFFDLLMRRLRAVDHPRFGYDPEARAFLKTAVLDETPWIDVEPQR